MRAPAEKVIAVGGIYAALVTELESRVETTDPRVQAALIDAAKVIAMGTDTRDMGIMTAQTSAYPVTGDANDPFGAWDDNP